MRRRNGFGRWIAVLAFAAIFVAEPRATLDVSWQAFKAFGQFGGIVVSELANDDNQPTAPSGEVDS